MTAAVGLTARAYFRSARPDAKAAVGEKDVRIGGDPTVAREYLKAGLVDHLHVAITPTLLGRGICLWDELRGLDVGYCVEAENCEKRRCTSHTAPMDAPSPAAPFLLHEK
ncbi:MULTISPECIES: dihydrofolate reductase family protein [Sphingomonas]|uniref:dihydrofolate reductase family protein n=1 Tax=Sphingomonas TaxID=13687 RepID=UPI002867CCCA|nr:dihydrofolate reductase family protein [Sphingomonas sp. CGMCC 1.13658]